MTVRTLLLLACVSVASVLRPDPATAQAVPKISPVQFETYVRHATLGIRTLQSWYSPATGLYRTTAWWNAANAITVLVEYSRLGPSRAYLGTVRNTFVRAQAKYPGFLNAFYDDEGWWALAWIAAYDATGDRRYLAMARSIFRDMTRGWDTAACGGGVWWSKERRYKNAIANELFLAVAARLANRVAPVAQRAWYRTWARREWAWFRRSGMVNAEHVVNDGLDSSDPARCVNNGFPTYSYNQGVILGGLVELDRAAPGDPALLATAEEIGDAAILRMTDADGVLHDPDEPDEGADGVQFKGIFVRNLAALDARVHDPRYARFVTANADSIWRNDRGPRDRFGQVWSGPVHGASAGMQASALDALIAAAEVSRE
jgi:predicted alpha-1,6-mannanase (GH76 family)